MLKLLLVAVVVVGLQADRLKGISKKEFRDENVELPPRIQRAGRYCLNHTNLDKYVNRIKNASVAKPSAFVCAFIAFQRSEVKVTDKYNKTNVKMRFKNFVKCVREIHELNNGNSSAIYGVTLFCDMTEEEKDSRTNGLILDGELVGGFGDENNGNETSDSDRKPGDSDMALPPDSNENSGHDAPDSDRKPGDSDIALPPDSNENSGHDAPDSDRKPGDSDIALPPDAVKGGFIGGDDISLPKIVYAEELLSRGIFLPSSVKSVQRDCITDDIEVIHALAALAGDMKTEETYACVFVAFQGSELRTSSSYENQDDAEMRYNLFKKCVDEVHIQNSEEDRTSTSGINFFCDLTEEEGSQYVGKLILPPTDESIELKGTPPTFLSAEYLRTKSVVLPNKLSGIESYCYDSKALQTLSLTAAETDDDMAYACAFVSFQAASISTVPAYTDEDIDERFELFAACAREVNEINSQNLTWTAAVNFFCDMTEEEKYPYLNGVRLPPEDEIPGKLFGQQMPLGGYYIGEDEISRPKIVALVPTSFTDILSLDISACSEGDVRELAAKENKEEKDYVCAFLAFQHSEIKATDPYTVDDVDERYDYFKNSLETIDEINANNEGWTAGITKFVDMNNQEMRFKDGKRG